MPVHKTISVKDEEFWNDCMKVANREGNSLSSIIMEGLKKYMKIHGDGNPVYVLDKFIEDPDFKAVPAVLSNKDKWVKFCQHTNDETLKQLEYQGMIIKIIANAYLNVDKAKREKTFFPSIRHMEMGYGGYSQ